VFGCGFAALRYATGSAFKHKNETQRGCWVYSARSPGSEIGTPAESYSGGSRNEAASHLHILSVDHLCGARERLEQWSGQDAAHGLEQLEQVRL
jgi:hypothetical protein